MNTALPAHTAEELILFFENLPAQEQKKCFV